MFNNLINALINRIDIFISRIGIKSSPSKKIKIRGLKEINKYSSRLRSSWRDKKIPEIQRELVNNQIKDFRNGIPILIFDSLVAELSGIENSEGQTLLEIGCSSGYYSEVLEIGGISLKYSGCDYSASFIELARSYYPDVDFYVCDARALPFKDSSFNIVISGCCILHIREYERAIQEAVRVSSRYVIFHRTPILTNNATTFYTKHAYGVEMLEIHFNEKELCNIFHKNNITVTKTVVLDAQFDSKGREISGNKLYFCIKND